MTSAAIMRLKAKHRRDELRALGLCTSAASHGPATHGVLCRDCRTTHRGAPEPKTVTGRPVKA